MAADLLLTGRLVTGTEALQLGLVAQVGDNPLDLATAVAADICRSGPVAVRTAVETLRARQVGV